MPQSVKERVGKLRQEIAEISEANRKQVVDFLNALDDHDDVHRVYAAMK